jgi:hypothetical protein
MKVTAKRASSLASGLKLLEASFAIEHKISFICTYIFQLWLIHIEKYNFAR